MAGKTLSFLQLMLDLKKMLGDKLTFLNIWQYFCNPNQRYKLKNVQENI